MDSSIIPKKRRLISDYFSPTPAPGRSTIGDKNTQVSTPLKNVSVTDADDTDSEWVTDNLDNQVESCLHGNQSTPSSLDCDSSSDVPRPFRRRIGRAVDSSDDQASVQVDDTDFNEWITEVFEKNGGHFNDDDDDEHAWESDEDDDALDDQMEDDLLQYGGSILQPPVFSPSINLNRPFAILLGGIITFLVSWSQKEIPRDEMLRAMNPGFWHLLRDLDVNVWLPKFLRAIPEQVQALFEKDSWSYDDLLSLQTVRDVGKRHVQGVYGIFLRSEHDDKEKEMGYVGSSAADLIRRSQQHEKIISHYTPDCLPRVHKTSRLYKHVCRRDYLVQPHFKVLAAFDEHIERCYILFLEGLFMILLRTFHLQRSSKWATRASFRLFSEVCEFFSIPQQLSGLNMAWCLNQHFPHPCYSKPSPCQNPACGVMTWPENLRPDTERAQGRILLDTTDYSKGFLCGPCYSFRLYRKTKFGLEDQFPDALWIKRHKTFFEERLTPSDPACDNCGLHRSERHQKKFRFSPLDTGKRYCYDCYRHVWTYGKERSEEEVELSLQHMQSLQAARDGRCRECEGCGETPPPDTPPKVRPCYNAQAKKVLCHACEGYYNRYHRLRKPGWNDVNEERRRVAEILGVNEKRRQVTEAFARGETIRCCFCKNVMKNKGKGVSYYGVGPSCWRTSCLEDRKTEDARLERLCSET